MPIARVSTCCRLLANLLTPLKVGGAVSDAAEETAGVGDVAIYLPASSK